MRQGLTRGAAGLSRTLHGRNLVDGLASGGVHWLAREFANRGTYIYRDYYGHLVEADLSDYMERIGFFGAHSAGLLRWLTTHLGPGDWVIDAGANVGLFASAMCAAVGPTGAVWAVEPLPRNIDRLQRLKDANGLGQLEIFPVALSSNSSVANPRLPATAGGSGFGSFVATWESSGTIEVPTRRLDELVEAGDPGRPLRALKLDVEGYESEVLVGAMATLTSRKPLVLCEFHDPLLRAAGSSSHALLAQFGSYGDVPREPYGQPSGSLDDTVTDMLLARVGEPAPLR